MERNVRLGLIFFVIATFIAYVITFFFFTIITNPIIIDILSGIFLFADYHFLIGVIIGDVYALRNRTSDQSVLKCGLIVGIVGGVFSALALSLWNTLIYMWSLVDFIVSFGFVLTSGVPVGLLAGAGISSYFMYRELKGEKKEEEKYDDDFFEDLIEK